MKKFILSLALSALCGAAAAQGYAGVLAGMADIVNREDCAGITCDENKAAFKIYGGYNISDTYSFELAYTDFGKVTATGPGGSAELKVNAISAGLAARYPLTTDLLGIGRIGVSYLKAKSTLLGSVESDSTTEAYLGLGLEYALASDFKLTTAVDVTDGGNIYLFGIGAQLDY